MKGMRYSYRAEGQEKIKVTGEKLCQEPEDLLSHSNRQLWGTVPGGKNRTRQKRGKPAAVRELNGGGLTWSKVEWWRWGKGDTQNTRQM